MKRFVLSGIVTFVLGALHVSAPMQSAQAGEFSYPWRSANSSIVLDAYEYTPIDWSKLSNNERLAAFITKGSDGLAPKYRCGSNMLCRVKWRRYAATKELYHTRKVLAKTLGMKWGAYHLARPGNPIQQAEHFLQFTKPGKDDLLALDIEHNDPRKWMSLSDAEIFARHIKKRVGRYPILYTNHHTSKFIAANKEQYPLLSRLNLWYARYKPTINGVFPMGNWDTYTFWQFSSMVNCNDKTCLRRINGAGNWIDVNVVAMPVKQLKREWPFAKLWADKKHPLPAEKPAADLLIASKSANTGESTLVSAYAEPAVVGTPASFAIEQMAPQMASTLSSVPTFRPGTKFVKAAIPAKRPVRFAKLELDDGALERTSDWVIAELGGKKQPVRATALAQPRAVVAKRIVSQTTPYFEASDFPGAF